MPAMIALLPCLVLEVYLWKLWSQTSGILCVCGGFLGVFYASVQSYVDYWLALL